MNELTGGTLAKRACPQCSAAAALAFQSGDFNRRVGEERFSYYRCPDCRLIFLSPVPADLSRYYPPDYYPIPASAAELESRSQHERYKVDMVRRFVQNGRLLEIGPATGGFALLAKKAGFMVEALEMDRRCCEFLDAVLGIRAIHGQSESAALGEAHDADVIALWHVIEHLAEPWALLERAVEKLRPNGILVLATPNPDAFQFRVLRQRWVHLDAPRHVSLIPRAVLVRRMERLGMRLCLDTTCDAGSLAWNVFGWEYSLAGLFRARLPRLAARALGRALAPLAAPFEAREGHGAAYTLVFRKPLA
jgi:SAM-dependent methyltransferase